MLMSAFRMSGGGVSLMRIRLQHRSEQGLLSSQELAPFGEGGVSHDLEAGSSVDVAVEIEVVVE